MKKLLGFAAGIILSLTMFAPVASAQTWGWAQPVYAVSNFNYNTPVYTYYPMAGYTTPYTTTSVKYVYNTATPYVSPYTKAIYLLSTLPTYQTYQYSFPTYKQVTYATPKTYSYEYDSAKGKYYKTGYDYSYKYAPNWYYSWPLIQNYSGQEY